MGLPWILQWKCFETFSPPKRIAHKIHQNKRRAWDAIIEMIEFLGLMTNERNSLGGGNACTYQGLSLYSHDCTQNGTWMS